MIQLNVTGKKGRASISCDSYMAAYDEKNDIVTIMAYKGQDRIHTTTVPRNGMDIQVDVMYLDPNIADKFNTSFKLKSLFPRKKAA